MKPMLEEKQLLNVCSLLDREKIMSREIEKLEVKFDFNCYWASRITILAIAEEKGIRTVIDQLEVSAYRSA